MCFVKASSDQGGKQKLAPVICKRYNAWGKHLKLIGGKQQDVMEMSLSFQRTKTFPIFLPTE